MRMKKSAMAAAPPAMPCSHCGGVLSWAADYWLAAHEQVYKCLSCGQLHSANPTMSRIAAVRRAVARSIRNQ